MLEDERKDMVRQIIDGNYRSYELPRWRYGKHCG
jgi:hypothetical protein